MLDTDVFVIGGGPAGLAAAIACRREGLRVIVADGDVPSIDKACGEGLMPDALASAARLGITIDPALGYPFRGIRFLGCATETHADFPNGTGLGIRRTALHACLVDTAERAGVQLRWGTPVKSLDDLRARWVVGADGNGSRVRRWAGLDRFARNTRRWAFRRHFAIAPWTGCMEIYWGDQAQFYVTPVSAREVCVALISRDDHLRFPAALPMFPELQARLNGAAATTAQRGAVSCTRRLRAVSRGRVALIGDASGSVDAITGQGLCLAFQQAEALAQAFASGDPGKYEAAHRRLSQRPAFMADFMLLLDRSGWVRRRALPALAARPDLFAQLLAMHVGNLCLAEFMSTTVQLGWAMV